MAVFVRKNSLICTVTITAEDGSNTQPSAVTAHLQYQDLASNTQTATFSLVYSSVTGQWTGVWDSSSAGSCTVCWVVYTDGSIEAAAQGAFEVVANAANVV